MQTPALQVFFISARRREVIRTGCLKRTLPGLDQAKDSVVPDAPDDWDGRYPGGFVDALMPPLAGLAPSRQAASYGGFSSLSIQCGSVGIPSTG